MNIEVNLFLLLGGLFIGLLLGIVIQRSKFCMAAAVSNLVLMKDYQQLHAYLAALIIAISGTQFLQSAGLVSLNETEYLSSSVNWLGATIGGIAFGVGTILSGGCVGRTLIRVGEGNIGSFIVVLAIGLTAYATMYGALEPFRVEIKRAMPLNLNSDSSSLTSISGLPSSLVSAVIVIVFLAIIFKSKLQPENHKLMLAGGIIGLLIVAGWWITGYLSQDLFSLHGASSLSFAGPLANTSYFLSTGSLLSEGAIFGLYLLLGTIIGSTISAITSNSFNWVLPDRHHIRHLIIGGMLMGFGAVIAGGCNIGHGLTGLSTCSLKSIMAVAAIAVGMRLGLFILMRTETLHKTDNSLSFLSRLINGHH